MNILFLDIDGVLCTNRAHYAMASKKSVMRAFDPVGIDFLNKMCREYNFETVMSSTWRNTPEGSLIDVRDCLISHGWQSYFNEHWRTPRKFSSLQRGAEIEMWMEEYGKPKNYLILDDNSDMLEEQKPYFVQTDTYDGILTKHMREIKSKLGAWNNESD